MSHGWAGAGSTRAWRKQRARILVRDQHACQIRLEGCTIVATQVHHRLGRGVSERDADLEAACVHCNNTIGDPAKHADPEPTPRTRW